jgi:hypothetical protein
MSEGWNGPVGPPATGSGTRLVAAGLMVVAAGLAVGGSFGAFVVWRFNNLGPGPDDEALMIMNGWRFDVIGIEIPPGAIGQPTLYGIPLSIAGGLAVTAAILLPLWPAIGRTVSMLAGGLLVGCAASIWFTLFAELANSRDLTAIYSAVDRGVGAWLVLAAAVIALVTACLVMALRPAGAAPYPYPVPPPGPGWSPGPYPTGPPPAPGWSSGPPQAPDTMSGSLSYQAVPPLPVPRRQLVAVVLLVVAAVLAVAGSVGTLLVTRTVTDTATAPTTARTTGWTTATDPPDPTGSVPLLGIPLVVGAVLALVAAALLVAGLRRPGDPTRRRLLGIGACGILVGTIVSIWLKLPAAVSLAAMLAARGNERTVSAGAGAWLLLVAGVVALAAVACLLAPVRRPALPPGWPGPPQQGPTPQMGPPAG